MSVFSHSEADFVGSALVRESVSSSVGDDDKIYFFFTEKSQELSPYFSHSRVARVARVCKVRGRSLHPIHLLFFMCILKEHSPANLHAVRGKKRYCGKMLENLFPRGCGSKGQQILYPIKNITELSYKARHHLDHLKLILLYFIKLDPYRNSIYLFFIDLFTTR